MDLDEDVSTRVLLKNVLRTEPPRSPVTRSKSQALLLTPEVRRSPRRSPRRSRSAANLLSPQVALQQKMKQRLHERASVSSVQQNKRHAVRTVGQQNNMSESTSSLLLNDDASPRVLLQRILLTEPERSLLVQEQPVEVVPPRSSESSLYSNRPSTGTSDLELPDLSTVNLTMAVRGISRKRPQRNFNLSTFEKKLDIGEEDREGDEKDNLSNLSARSESFSSLSLKTPYIDPLTEKRGMRRAIKRRAINVEDFEEGVQNRLASKRNPDMEHSVAVPAVTLSETGVLEKFTLGLSDLTAPEATDIIMNSTELYAQPISEASQPAIQDGEVKEDCEGEGPLEVVGSKDTSTGEKEQGQESDVSMEKDCSHALFEEVNGEGKLEGIASKESMEGSGLISEGSKVEVKECEEEEEMAMEERTAESDQEDVKENVEESMEGSGLISEGTKVEVKECEEEEEMAMEERTAESDQEDVKENVEESMEGSGLISEGTKVEVKECEEEEEMAMEERTAESDQEDMKENVEPEDKHTSQSGSNDNSTSDGVEGEESKLETPDDVKVASEGEVAMGSSASSREEDDGVQQLFGFERGEEEVPAAEHVTRQRAYHSEGGAKLLQPGTPVRGYRSLGTVLGPRDTELGETPAFVEPSQVEQSPERVYLALEEGIRRSPLLELPSVRRQFLQPSDPHGRKRSESTKVTEGALTPPGASGQSPVESLQEEDNLSVSPQPGSVESDMNLPQPCTPPSSEPGAAGVEEEEEENEEESEEDGSQSVELSMNTPAFVRQKKVSETPGPLTTPAFLKAKMKSRKLTQANSTKPKRRQRAPATQKGPGLPKSYLMSTFRHFAKTTVSTDVYPVLKDIMDKFFDRLADDLEVYATHAKRKTIEVEDVELLLRRQGFVTDSMPVNVLIEKYLPLEYRKLLIPVATSGNNVVPKQKK